MVSVSQHDDIPGESRGPGVTRKITIDKSTGSGAITAGVVFLEPGGLIPPHTHLVEEAITLIEGHVKILDGTETAEVTAPASWLAPANKIHATRNIGDGRATLVIAYPANEVGATRVDVEF
jgi:quercetin dioxygenase-like cupin family protein